jgi:predicted enzyme related to lactoylglutathione lyase
VRVHPEGIHPEGHPATTVGKIKERREPMRRVVHFEINADDLERAVKFYQKVFGWKIEKWNGPVDYWLVMTGPNDQPGINGGIMKRMNLEASTYNTVDVPSVDEFTKKITEQGGRLQFRRWRCLG